MKYQIVDSKNVPVVMHELHSSINRILPQAVALGSWQQQLADVIKKVNTVDIETLLQYIYEEAREYITLISVLIFLKAAGLQIRIVDQSPRTFIFKLETEDIDVKPIYITVQHTDQEEAEKYAYEQRDLLFPKHTNHSFTHILVHGTGTVTRHNDF